jgi:trk system potassium uptake protein TrkA
MLACRIAATLSKVPTKIARIRTADYLACPELFSANCLGVDHVISPEEEVTRYLERLIDYPEALQVLEFAGGRIGLAAMRAERGGPLVGRPLSVLRSDMPQVETRVAAIFRKDRAIPPEGTTMVQEGDEIFVVAVRDKIGEVLREVHGVEEPVRRVMIGGGGNIGRRLAKALEGRCEVKLIERNERKCRLLAQELENTLVLHGETADEALLVAENVDNMDVFLSLTNDDQDNIISSLIAKKAGVRRVIALVNQMSYVNLVQGGKIDIAVSPAQTTIGTLLAHVRSGNLARVHSLRLGAAEAMEIIVQGGRVVGRSLGDSDLPRGITVGAVVRGDEVFIAHRSTVIEEGDHIIVFVVDRKLVRTVEHLFRA